MTDQLLDVAKGDRVAYTVTYGGIGRANHQRRTEYGHVTRLYGKTGARQQDRVRIAVENPRPGAAKYVERYVADLVPAPLPAGGPARPAERFTRAQVTVALATAHGMVDNLTDALFLERLAVATWKQLGRCGALTREQVTDALNAAADAVRDYENPEDYETSESIWTDDVLNLTVNVAAYLLGQPGGTLHDAIVASYTDTVPDFDNLPAGCPIPKQGTPLYDDALVSTVLGWIA